MNPVRHLSAITRYLPATTATRAFVGISFLASTAMAQPAQIRAESNYNGWGWDAVVLDNGLVTVTVVPEIGGRVMQYDLGQHRAIFVNEDEIGKCYQPNPGDPWHNFGGYKVWPAPQSAWGWPPPPTLDTGPYEWEITAETDDSVSVLLRSPVEQWRTPGLRLERSLTLYAGSSHLRVEQTIVNEGDQAQRWSVWDVTQHIVNHPGETDYDNFWVYFPINPDSRYGDLGVRTSAASAAWAGEAAPGVYGVVFRPEGKKIFADSHHGWVAYVDRRERYAYLKTFAVQEDQTYPDDGARVEVWINKQPLYLEVEVLGPIADIPPGGRTTFVEDWWATRLEGPVTGAGPAGAVARPLVMVQGHLRGTYGPFHSGTIEAIYFDAAGAEVRRGGVYDVTPMDPMDPLELRETPLAAARVELHAIDASGRDLGIIDAVDLRLITAVEESAGREPARFALDPAYPNPFNSATVIPYRVPAGGARIDLTIHDVGGRRVRSLADGQVHAGHHVARWDGRDGHGRSVASGLYVARLRAVGGVEVTTKLVLLR